MHRSSVLTLLTLSTLTVAHWQGTGNQVTQRRLTSIHTQHHVRRLSGAGPLLPSVSLARALIRLYYSPRVSCKLPENLSASLTVTRGLIITSMNTGQEIILSPSLLSVPLVRYLQVPWFPPSNVSTTPEWGLTITDASSPIWFFCKQLISADHCSSGMAGAINAPTSGNNFCELPI